MRGLGAANFCSSILVALAEQISRIETRGLAAAHAIVLSVNFAKRVLSVGQRLSHRLFALIVLRVCCILLLLSRCFPLYFILSHFDCKYFAQIIHQRALLLVS